MVWYFTFVISNGIMGPILHSNEGSLVTERLTINGCHCDYWFIQLWFDIWTEWKWQDDTFAGLSLHSLPFYCTLVLSWLCNVTMPIFSSLSLCSFLQGWPNQHQGQFILKNVGLMVTWINLLKYYQQKGSALFFSFLRGIKWFFNYVYDRNF